HDAPGTDVGATVELEGATMQRSAQVRNRVVAAGNAQSGLAEAAEDAPEMRIAGRVVLDQVARHQDGITHGEMPGGVCQRAVECLERVHAAQRPGRITKQVWVCELDDSDRAHSFALYKHADKCRVMWFTGWVIPVKRIEPCRKLPAGKCESASASGDPPRHG